jgi:hypothetical protein
MKVCLALLAFVLSIVPAFGDDTVERSKLIGKWQQPNSDSVWILNSSGDILRITHMTKITTPIQFECNTAGRECAAKESGRDVKVSMWFNGPKLVQQTHGARAVIRRRFRVIGDGNKLEIEVASIDPAGKTEVSTLDRVGDRTPPN